MYPPIPGDNKDTMQLIEEVYKRGRGFQQWTKVDNNLVDKFRGAVPPIDFKGGFAMGETYDCQVGVDVYYCFVNGYCRICSIEEAEVFAKSYT